MSGTVFGSAQPIGHSMQQFPLYWSEKSHCYRWFQELAVKRFIDNCVFLGCKCEHAHSLVFQKSPCSPLFSENKIIGQVLVTETNPYCTVLLILT
jgi:hypothetical protein